MRHQTLAEKVLMGVATLEDIHDEFYEICDNVHAMCNDECPVYELNGSEAPNVLGTRYECDCFKNGKKMAEFIHGKHVSDKIKSIK